MNKKRKTTKSQNKLNRRDFLKVSGGIAVGLANAFSPGRLLANAGVTTIAAGTMNILLIVTDQQHFDTIAADGCSYVDTPALDKLLTEGYSFSKSYSTNPVCSPARSSIFTGRMPTETGVYQNQLTIREDIPNIGQWFTQQTNYETIYSGKWHIPQSYQRDIPGFTVIQTGLGGQGNICDTNASRACEGFLWNRTNTNPFLMVASFLQPHDICEWLRINTYAPAELRYSELAGQLPALPANFNYDLNEPAKLISKRQGLDPADGGGWTEEHWQFYKWCYYRHIEMVDAEIGRVLQALEDSGYAQNTLIVFTSDHGEGLAHHQYVRKSTLYDEAARVRLIFHWPGNVLQNHTDTSHLVSGVDIMPTLCEYAGIAPPAGVVGKSVKPLLEGSTIPWRKCIVSDVTQNIGRMVRSDRYKYVTYNNDPVEQLFDMESDPGEVNNLAADPQYNLTLFEHREMLRAWESRLDLAPDMPQQDAWWRKSCDFNKDGLIDCKDLAAFAAFWLDGTPEGDKYDLNNDGTADFSDIDIINEHWQD